MTIPKVPLAGPRPDSIAPPRSDARAAVLRSERGSMSLSALIGFTLFVIPSLIFVLAIPPWESRTADARDAAHNAARALALTPNWAQAEAAAAEEVAGTTGDDGVPTTDVSANYTYSLPSGASLGPDGTLAPGSTVTAAVTVVIPAGYIPGVGTYASVHYTATYTATIDSYAADNG